MPVNLQITRSFAGYPCTRGATPSHRSHTHPARAGWFGRRHRRIRARGQRCVRSAVLEPLSTGLQCRRPLPTGLPLRRRQQPLRAPRPRFVLSRGPERVRRRIRALRRWLALRRQGRVCHQQRRLLPWLHGRPRARRSTDVQLSPAARARGRRPLRMPPWIRTDSGRRGLPLRRGHSAPVSIVGNLEALARLGNLALPRDAADRLV